MATLRSRSRQGPTKLVSHTIVDSQVPGINGTHAGVTEDTTVESMSDYVTSSFGYLLRSGVVINNPCSYVKDRVYGTGATAWTERRISPVRTISGSGGSVASAYIKVFPTFCPAEPAALTIPDGVIQKVRLQALANVDKTPYSFAEDVAEFHQTLTFLRNPFSAMRDLSRLFAKDISKKKQTLARAKLIANAWTEYRFAFSPLLRSAISLIDSFQTTAERPKRRSSRGASDYSNKVVANQTVQTNFFWSTTSSIHADVRSSLLYEVSNPITDWKFKYGLRAKDIPVTLWAIMPYSFMVDRLVNITSSFQAMTNFLDPQVKILAGSVTTRKDLVRERTLNRSSNPAGWIYSHPSSSQRRETFSYERTLWSPTALDLIPTVELGGLVDGSTKIADLAALVVQRLK